MEKEIFGQKCLEYFQRNFEILAGDAPLILPWKKPCELETIVNSMTDWCTETNKSFVINELEETHESICMKGLVLHSFPIYEYLEWYGFTEDTLHDLAKIENFKDPIIVIYNPSKNVILLIRRANNENLATEIKISRNNLKMFIILFHDVLKESRVKVLPLVVTDGKSNSYGTEFHCDLCENHVLSVEELKKFESWRESKNSYFVMDSEVKIDEKFSKRFLAKVTGFTAAKYIHSECVPIFLTESFDSMNNLKVLLTPEQTEIFYSQDKHIIIKGGFGCGKTIVAAAILERLLENKNQKVYHICYDSRSSLNHFKDKKQSYFKHNREGRNLSEVIENIMEEEKSTKEINFVVDEYDSENLSISEAERLNKIFTASLKDSFILLNVQPIEKTRIIDNTQQAGNKFDLLTSMKTYQLTLNMRNSVQIHELVKATKVILGQEETISFHSNDINTDEEPTPVKESKGKEKPLPNSKPSPRDSDKPIIGTKYTGITSEEKAKLTLDEAQAIAASSSETTNGGNKIISKFKYAEVDQTGHNIKLEIPGLLELGDCKEFEKILSLIALFEKLDIRNKKHVILHFDTISTGIPITLNFVFNQYFNLNGKVTSNYEEFIRQQKPILACGCTSFRGLEHPNITVIIDRDIYFLQHYLVEAIARCTSELNVVVLQNSQILTKVIKEWKNTTNRKQLIRVWKTEIRKDVIPNNKFVIREGTIEATFRNEDYEKLVEEFHGLSSSKDEAAKSENILLAKKTIKEKR